MNRVLKLTVAYEGTAYVGWQRQAEGVSIQGLLEEALARLDGAPVVVHGAGRTDAGVHALGQVASARVATTREPAVIRRALNAMLPGDVRVLSVEEAPRASTPGSAQRARSTSTGSGRATCSRPSPGRGPGTCPGSSTRRRWTGR